MLSVVSADRRYFRDHLCLQQHGDDGVIKYLWNVGKIVPGYTAQRPRRLISSRENLKSQYNPSWFINCKEFFEPLFNLLVHRVTLDSRSGYRFMLNVLNIRGSTSFSRYLWSQRLSRVASTGTRYQDASLSLYYILKGITLRFLWTWSVEALSCLVTFAFYVMVWWKAKENTFKSDRLLGWNYMIFLYH